MRFRGSYTLESSYIVPLFTIIIVILIQLMLFLHDRAVYSAVEVKINMQEEFSGKDYEREAEEYLKKRLVFYGAKINIGNADIKENNMSNYARISKAWLGGKE